MKIPKAQILLLDDEAPWLRVLANQLATEFPDFQIVGLASEKQFQQHIAASREHEAALVLADAVLGPLDRGADVLAFCRQRLPHVRRVLMSNKASREDLEDAINRCALDGYVEKNNPLGAGPIALLKRLLTHTQVIGPINDMAACKTCDDFANIDAGEKKQANLYKNAIKDLLAYAFYPWLIAPQTEVAIRNATKAVDIMLQNAAREGILADLKRKYDSLLVPVETKNSKTLHSGYFSQLEGYLTRSVGKWGIICFRGAIERKHLLHVKAAHTEGKLIMLLTDSELVELCRAKFSERQTREDYQATLDQFLRSKYGGSL